MSETYNCDNCNCDLFKQPEHTRYNFEWVSPDGGRDDFEFCKKCYDRRTTILEGKELETKE